MFIVWIKIVAAIPAIRIIATNIIKEPTPIEADTLTNKKGGA
jgi:hypothetical protein